MELKLPKIVAECLASKIWAESTAIDDLTDLVHGRNGLCVRFTSDEVFQEILVIRGDHGKGSVVTVRDVAPIS